jgi:hypothetical protein
MERIVIQIGKNVKKKMNLFFENVSLKFQYTFGFCKYISENGFCPFQSFIDIGRMVIERRQSLVAQAIHA